MAQDEGPAIGQDELELSGPDLGIEEVHPCGMDLDEDIIVLEFRHRQKGRKDASRSRIIEIAAERFRGTA